MVSQYTAIITVNTINIQNCGIKFYKLIILHFKFITEYLYMHE